MAVTITQPTQELWAPVQIARYLDVNRTTIFRLVRRDPSFPAPVVNYHRARLWNAEAVREWASKQKRYYFAFTHEKKKP